MQVTDERPAALDPTKVFETLNHHGVDYIVIGALRHGAGMTLPCRHVGHPARQSFLNAAFTIG
jgi:hypothetical protein